MPHRLGQAYKGDINHIAFPSSPPVSSKEVTDREEVMPTFAYKNLDAAAEDEYSRLWTWYVAHLESGEFEGIVQDTYHRRLLDRFIAENSASYDSNVLVLLMPTQEINRNPSMLTSLMSKYYANSDVRDVTITPMGSIRETQTSVILIKSKSSNSHPLAAKTTVTHSMDSMSVLSGEPGYVPSVLREDDEVSIVSETVGSPLSGDSMIGAENGPIIRVETQLSSSQYSFEVGESEVVSVATDATGLSLQPFPTMVSATSSVEHKLVLRSMLLKDLQTGEMKTAIRQIEGTSMGDDWLVYDETFTMTNLQLLSLEDIVDMNAMSSKFLFYALIADTSSYDYEETDDEIGEHDLTVVEFDGGLGLDHLSPPIRFIQSNTTQATTPINLSKTNTLHTNHESVRSEMLMHRPDNSYAPVLRSKSTPTASSIRKLKKKKSKSRINNDKCMIM